MALSEVLNKERLHRLFILMPILDKCTDTYLRMNSLSPAKIAPTGAPNPLLIQNVADAKSLTMRDAGTFR